MSVTNLSELIAVVAGAEDVTRALTERIVKRFLGEIRGNVIAGTAVKLQGFGSFYVRKGGRWRGRHPVTGKVAELGGRTRPSFRASEKFVEAVHEKWGGTKTPDESGRP